MIADIVDDTIDVRLITRNVMAVYSTNNEYTDSFIRKLKHSNYIVNKKKVSSDSFISYIKKTYNIYENIFRFVKRHKDINYSKFVEYLDFLDLSHLLWTHFYQLSSSNLSLVEIIIQLSTNKEVVIIDYIDNLECRKKLYTLLFHVGLEDRLIIVPFRNIDEACNNSTCQCYVKSLSSVKIQSKFPNEYIEKEFNITHNYYTGTRPVIYTKSDTAALVKPVSYKYTLYEILLIMLYSIKMLYIQFNNWRTKIHVN